MLFNRLWPLIVLALVSAVVGFFVPQVPAIATGYCLLVALLWRNQSRAVEAIEGTRRRGVLARPQLAVRPPAAAAAARAAQDRARALAQPRLRSLSSSGQGRVLATWSAVSHARRAVATP